MRILPFWSGGLWLMINIEAHVRMDDLHPRRLKHPIGCHCEHYRADTSLEFFET